MNKTYKLSELKGILKVGDKVKVGFCLETNEHNIGTITQIDMPANVFYINGCPHDFNSTKELTIISEPKTMDNLEVGDVLVNKHNGYDHKVQAICGELIFYSTPQYFNRTHAYQHIEDIKTNFTLKTQDPEPDTISIAGKKYNKAEFENAVKNLKEIKQ